jgi:predicted Fe-S protein YdhL (DUF1289 family)
LDEERKICAKNRLAILTRVALHPIARREGSGSRFGVAPFIGGSVVDSPCIKICELNRDDVCVGCGRTRAEIAGWMSMSESQKAKVVELAEKRRSTSARSQLEPSNNR